MKKHLPLYCLIFLAHVNYAQPVFSYPQFAPQNSDTYTVGRATPPAPGPSGANQTWNFSSSSILTTVTYIVGAANWIPCSSQYPNATQAIGTGGSYDMIKVSSTDYQTYGTTLTPSMPGYMNSDPRKVFAFPMNYLNSFTDTYFGVDPNGVYEYGNETVTYDGYGTLTTPYFTYPNALRIHCSFTMTDSTTSVNCTGTMDYYYWFAPGYPYPVTAIWSSTGNCGIGLGCEFLQGISSGSGIEDASLKNNFSVYPNPFNENLTVQLNNLNGNAVAEIFNVLGEKIYTLQITDPQTEINLGKLQSGIYFMKVTTSPSSGTGQAPESVTKKLVKTN